MMLQHFYHTSYLLLAFSLLISSSAFAQSVKREIIAHWNQQLIEVDGVKSENEWSEYSEQSDFTLNFPNDQAQATEQTKVNIAYDADFLYVLAECYYDDGHDPTSSTLRRDFPTNDNDFFGIVLGTYNDGLNGFAFSVSPMGVMREDMIGDGSQLNIGWDNRWKAKAKIMQDKWVVEMAIPWKTLRFRDGTKNMEVNFIRNNLVSNEQSAWQRVPINFNIFSMAFTGRVSFETPLKSPGSNVSLIPYATTKASQQYLQDGEKKNQDPEASWSVGGDAKIALTSALNLDLTVNPDFSQVEVDQQVTNLDRFEIFFPERRQFFLENEDLFARFGFSRIRPFFSRRIGIGTDSTTGTIVQNPILFGARLSGKLNPDLRIGLLNIQTAEDSDKGISPNNYTVMAAQHKVFSRSNVGLIMVNRTNSNDLNDYTRVVGIDYNLQSADGAWWGKFYFHKGFTPDHDGDAITHATFLRYQAKNWSFAWNHEYVDDDYQINDIGFVRRQPHWRLEPSFTRIWFMTHSQKVNRISVRTYHDLYTKLNGEETDYNTDLTVEVVMQDRSGFYFRAERSFIQIINQPFDPTNTDGRVLEVGSRHRFAGLLGGLDSAPGKKLTYSLDMRYGQYYNGMLGRVSGDVSYRVQPYGSIGISGQYNSIDLPDDQGFSDAELILLGVNTNISFTKSIFLTSFIQVNNQSNNINHNTRLQWRFAPVSDFFLVYTENYTSDDVTAKNRALVMKLTYWLGL